LNNYLKTQDKLVEPNMELNSIIPTDSAHKAEIEDHSKSLPPPTVRPRTVSNKGVKHGLKRSIEMLDPKTLSRPRTKQRKLVSIQEDEEDNLDRELQEHREMAAPKYTDEEVERIIESLRGAEDIEIKVEEEFDDKYILSMPCFSKRPKVSQPSNQMELPVPPLAVILPNATSPKVVVKATVSNRRRRIFHPWRPADRMAARTIAKPNAEASGNA
jgi:hypothetical protein